MTAYALESSLDTAAATPLRQELLNRIDARQPILLDGAEVMRVGLACLQVLTSARIAAEAEGLPFAINNPSAALRDMAALARLDAVLEPAG